MAGFDPFTGVSGGSSGYPDVQRRLMLAKLLAEQGDAAPATTPLGVVGKTLSGALQGYLMNGAMQDSEARDQGKLDTMAQALQAGQGGVKEFRNPDSPGQVLIPGQQPGMDAMVSVLMGNKDTAPLGLKQAMDSMALKQKAQLQAPDVKAVYDPATGRETKMQFIPGQGWKPIGGVKAPDLGPGVMMDNGVAAPVPRYGEVKGGQEADVIRATTPAKVDQENALNTGTAATAATKAATVTNAETPALVNRAAQTAQATQPIDVETARQKALNDRNINQPVRDRTTEKGLREEFNALPPVKNYRETVTQYNGIVEASKRDSKASDLNMVYGLAKIFDPGSVVREGETLMVQNTASLPDWLQGTINSLNGGARLTPETRKALLTEAAGRVKAQESVFAPLRDSYTGIAGRYGVNPQNVIADIPTPSAPAQPIAPPARADIEAEMRRRGLLK